MGAKRTFDLMTASIGLVILSPLFVVIACAVRCDTRGPVFYRGVRTGLNGIPFRIIKFRTMVPDAESLGGRVTARDDARVTRVGRVLRRYKLDELPQLINVIKGDMSVVGPRPEVSEYTALYTDEERLILSVRPGITDYASIEFVQLGEAVGSDLQDGAFEDRVRKVLEIKNALRVKYVRKQTFMGDIKLILLTLRKLIIGR
jgi:lipopolysaccharide/colanic/teichoic acid biosynthesis glycosyltransferase|tara:strand:- start:2616 stop:3221 length:606 start_codon:yes stop_codon:yes gene_type:complete